MFFVINPMGCIDEYYYKNPKYNVLHELFDYYVLDTDDLVVEKVSYAKLFKLLDSELASYFYNVDKVGSQIWIRFRGVGSCFDLADYHPNKFMLLNNSLELKSVMQKYNANDTLVINGKINTFNIHKECDSVYFWINNTKVAEILDLDGFLTEQISLRIAYLFRLNDMLVIRIKWWLYDMFESTYLISVFYTLDGKFITLEYNYDKCNVRDNDYKVFKDNINKDYTKYVILKRSKIKY
jgi:hypothetical protein